ncbi:MAG: substrate-binding domain-containing protein [Lachnospiraceae bacterium]|jgi:LacI family transcriptional regulator|nr:substrate-binding domain-containing protein [Lachnospiraceae bacterium]
MTGARDASDKITLKTIADHVGTSVGTVDRAINNRPGISEDMRRAVLKIAEDLGYEAQRRPYTRRRKEAPRIAVAYPRQPDSFYRVMDAGVCAGEAKFAPQGVIVDKIRYHRPTPADAMESLSALDPSAYDALALVAPGAEVNATIERFATAGLPVVTVNSDTNCSARQLFIGADAKQSGCIAAEMLALMTHRAGAIVGYLDLGQTAPGIVRFSGLDEYMRTNYPNIEVLSCIDDTSEDMEKSDRLASIISMTNAVNGVFCTGPSSTVIVANTLKSLGRGDIAVVGYDISPSTYAAVREGWCHALIYQDPFQQGYLAVKLLANHLRHGAALKAGDASLENLIVTRGNIDRYYDPGLFADYK